MLQRIESPKLTSKSRRSSLYSYYAGFSEAFVDSLIDSLDLSDRDLVADPWNGSGTTTAACSRRGIPSIGLDLNPAMRPIAAMRSARLEDIQFAVSSMLDATSIASSTPSLVSPFAYLGSTLNLAKQHCPKDAHDCLRFIAMASSRKAARVVRSKNPTWYSQHELAEFRIDRHLLIDQVEHVCKQLIDTNLRHPTERTSTKPTLVTGDALTSRIRRPITHIITSPPYLTRIDYVVKTMPELLVLSHEKEIDIKALRTRMLGGVLTTRRARRRTLSSQSGAAAIKRINDHISKASSTYYRTFFFEYMLQLERSIRNILRFSDDIKTITVVTQGSYYKEIFVDLPLIIDELMKLNGFVSLARNSFRAKHNIVVVNSRSVASEMQSPPEIAATYAKGS